MYNLFFLLIPIGLCLLVVGIRNTVRLANPEKVYELPYVDEKGTFTIDEPGKYSVWLNGKLLQKIPIGEFGLSLTNCETRLSIPLYKPLLPARVNGFKIGRIELYDFKADAGTYSLERTNFASMSDRMRQSVGHILLRKPIDYNQFSFQLYRQTSKVALSLSIIGIVIGFITFILGILLPIAFSKM